MDYQHLLDRIMELDKNIRFLTVCDLEGKTVATQQREGVTNFLTPEETTESLDHAVSSWKSRMKLSDKIGKGKYVLAVYEKLRRVTMPLGDDHLLLLTLDNKGGQADIIEGVQNLLHGDYTKY